MSLNWLWWLNIFFAVLVLLFWAVGVSIPASDLSTTSRESQNELNTSLNDSIAVEKIYFSNTPFDGDNEIYVMNSDGSGLQQLTNHAGKDAGPELSPDKKKIVFYVHYDNFNWSIFLMNADGSDITRLTITPNVCDCSPAWSPDGEQITFSRWYPNENSRSEVWVMNADGSNQHHVGNFDGSGPDWSPDGSRLLFHSKVGNDYHICIADTDGSNFQQLTNIGTANEWPAYSPNGSKIAFQSNRDGNYEIYVMNANGSNPVRLTDNSCEDLRPCWSPDSTRMVFSSFRDGKYDIYKMNANDSSDQIRLTTLQVHNIQPDWGVVREPMNKYLGQTPPDSIPEIFAPGMVSTPEGAEYACAFTPDGTEFYFTRYDEATGTNNIWVTKLNCYNQWTAPALASFNQGYSYNIEPCISPDGQKLFFISVRPAGAPPSIWYVDRIDTGWSDPQVIEELLSEVGKMGPSVAANGNLYFCQHEGSRIQIYMSENNNGVYETPVKLGEGINHFYIAGHPFIAPDESYLLFDACPNCPTSEELYLYISFKRPDDGWYPAIKLNNLVNATDIQLCASVSPDGKYLFFDRGEDIYWVDAEAFCIAGDADNSGSIDISDVIYLINYLFKEGPAPEPWIAGDSNNDDTVSVSDVVYLINYIFRGGPKPSC